MEALPALELWDTIIDVFEPDAPLPFAGEQNLFAHTAENRKTQGPQNDFDVDWVSTTLKTSPHRTKLIILEDNEAVIKMAIKGRSMLMRHVSRTHRIDLSWLFERLIKDPVIRIKYVNTKDQLADILTKGSFSVQVFTTLLNLIQMGKYTGSTFTSPKHKITKIPKHPTHDRQMAINTNPNKNPKTHSAASTDNTPSTPRKPKKTSVSEDVTPSKKDIKNFFQKTLGLPDSPKTPIKHKKTFDSEDVTPSMEDIRTFFKNTSVSNKKSALTTVHADCAILSNTPHEAHENHTMHASSVLKPRPFALTASRPTFVHSVEHTAMEKAATETPTASPVTSIHVLAGSLSSLK